MNTVVFARKVYRISYDKRKEDVIVSPTHDQPAHDPTRIIESRVIVRNRIASCGEVTGWFAFRFGEPLNIDVEGLI